MASHLTGTESVYLVDPKGLPEFFHIFSMALYHKWDVKKVFAYVLQFFSLIFDGLGGVARAEICC